MHEAACVVGIDVGKRKLDIALLVNGKTNSKVFDNIPAGHALLRQWLAERGTPQEHTHICMEATGPYSEVVAIALAGWRVSVVNPARIKGFAQGGVSAQQNRSGRCRIAGPLLCGHAPQPVDTTLTSLARIARLGGWVASAQRYAPNQQDIDSTDLVADVRKWQCSVHVTARR